MYIAIILLGTVGAIAALILFAVSKKFEVHEDPRIGQIQEALPGANCGGCGFPGCGGALPTRALRLRRSTGCIAPWAVRR